MANDAPAVTVLVPVYNVEHYLRTCLDSLAAQTLANIEFVCIDDGSTDSCPDILAEYAARDPRFHVITKENSGYGASMNRGLDEARGEYIGIVESDDFAAPDMFETYYKVAKRHSLDLVKSNYFEHSGEGDTLIRAFGRRTRLWGTFDPVHHPELVLAHPLIWSALYRREMLVEEKIRFLETPGASYQDTSFVMRCWFAARRVRILQGAYLHYRVDNVSSSVKSSSKVFEVCSEFAAAEAFLMEQPDRIEAFMPMFQVAKFNTYRWNYNRIIPESRPSFADTWARECHSSIASGYLKSSDFASGDWRLIEEIAENPALFASINRDGIPMPIEA